MANASDNTSLSLLDSPTAKPAMSQEVADDGTVVFKCTMCSLSYKHLKRLQTHLKVKHNVTIDLDETVTSGQFSPKMASTHEDCVEDPANTSPKTSNRKVEAEPTKNGGKKRDRDSTDEDDDTALESYRAAREKRAKMFESLEQKFETEIGDKTMEEAVEAERSNLEGGTQAMTDKISQAIREAEGDHFIFHRRHLL